MPAGCTTVQNNGNSIVIAVTSGFVSGTLSVSASNGCGVGVVRTRVINGRPATPATITGPNAVCPDSQNVAFSTTDLPGFSYNWTLPSNASLVSGAGTASVSVNFGNNGGSVVVNASNACGTSSNRSLTVSMLTCREGVEVSLIEEPSISVFPNPGKGLYTLTAKGFEHLALVSVYNMLGQLVKTQTIHAETIENKLDLTSIPSGVYMLKVEAENFNKSLKLVKE